MKRRLTITFSLLVLFLAACWAMGQSRWHLDRNARNALPTGTLTLKQGMLYEDTTGREWIRLPAHMNAFHQPKKPVAAPPQPYGDAISKLTFEYEADNPNLKFLSKTEDGGSFEAILQTDGTYLETGPHLGTYNYGHPQGAWGMVRHAVWDVLPHFANGNYRVSAEKLH